MAGREGAGVRRSRPQLANAIAALAIASVIGAAFTGEALAATPAEAAALRAQPCPTYIPLRNGSFSSAELAKARSGEFEVMNTRPAKLVPPVNWRQDPYRARSWTHYLHAFRWLDPLLYLYATRGDRGALTQARNLVLDWIRANPRGGAGVSPDAWRDKATGERAASIAYVARAAACEGLLRLGEAPALIDAIRAHARFLAAPENHNQHNHALFVDLGLAVTGEYFVFLRGAPSWVRLARDRFLATMRRGLKIGEWLWLEHSSTYQLVAIRLLERFIGAIGGDRQLEALADRMRATARWLVMPNGRIAPLGDSNETVAPSWATSATGMRVMPRSGLAVVSKRGGYLAITAGFHDHAHKQADDLGFHLYDRGLGVVTDTGLFHYDLDRWRAFSASSAAHSVLTVDGQSFPYWDTDLAYGSGILAAGRGNGWYAVLARNPIVRSQRVRHRRLFLYQPGRALLVLDRVRSRHSHSYRRYFQLGPQVDIASGQRGVSLRAPGFRGKLVDTAKRSRRSAIRGRYNPPAGWSFNGFRVRKQRWTVEYGSRARKANYLAAFGLRGGVRARLAKGDDGTRIAVSGQAVKRSVLEVDRHKGRLKVRVHRSG